MRFAGGGLAYTINIYPINGGDKTGQQQKLTSKQLPRSSRVAWALLHL